MAKEKGFAAWNNTTTEPLVRDIEAVLEEYRAHLPLTIRQIFYRLVGRGYEKDENFYERVDYALIRARRSGRIPFSAIRDDGLAHHVGEDPDYCYEAPDAYYASHEELPNYYSRSWHAEQPRYVQVHCEASGGAPLLARAVRGYRVSVTSCGKFDSLTVKHDLFQESLKRFERYGQTTTLLHFGDHDASGYFIHESLREDLEAFCGDSGLPEIIRVRRIALTPQLIEEMEIIPDVKQPTANSKSSQAREFVRRGLLPAAQLEAVPPDVLSHLVREAVEDALDMDVLRASQEQERLEHQIVQEKLDEVNEVLREAFDIG